MTTFVIDIVPLFEPQLLALLVGSVALGLVAGALPGISATMGVAIVSPLTFHMEPVAAILTLVGIYCGAIFGGSIAAILLGIPGTPGAIATAADGYPMAQRGEAGRAIGTAIVSSFLGGTFSGIVLIVLAYPIAGFALAFGPREYLALAFFAMSAIASLSGGSFLRGFLTGFIGMFVASIGIDETFGVSRFHYGSGFLIGGIAFVPVMIGLFAIPEILASLDDRREIRGLQRVHGILPGLSGLVALLPAQLRSSVIGVIVGAVPGAGADIAAIISYGQGRTWSRAREAYGTGHPEGVACAESANNAAAGGTLIPLLTLGIPGGAVTAILLGTFMIHGLQPGPLLLEHNADIVHQIIGGFLLANLAMLFLGLASARLLSRVLLVPQYALAPAVLMLCVIGSFAMRNTVVDVGVMILAGLFGYVLMQLNYPRAPLALGLILGPMIEAELSRTFTIIHHWTEVFTPISSVIWFLAVVPVLLPLLIGRGGRAGGHDRRTAGGSAES